MVKPILLYTGPNRPKPQYDVTVTATARDHAVIGGFTVEVRDLSPRCMHAWPTFAIGCLKSIPIFRTHMDVSQKSW